MKLLNKYLSFIAIFVLSFAQVLTPLTILAQEATPEPSPEVTASPAPEPSVTPTPSVEPSPSPTVSPEPSSTPEPAIEPSPSPTPTPSLDESLTISPATQSAAIDTSSTENQSSASLAPPVWQTSEDGSATTINNVVLNQTYITLQNDKVTITFTKLPDNPGTLTIKEVTLTDEQVKQTGALSNIAYDITSTMENGTFEYTLTLPTPKTENVEVKASENGETFVTLGSVTAQQDTLTITGLNHFTVFVVVGTITSGVATPFINESGASVVINEFVYHPSVGQNEWIEFFNKTNADISLTGWTLVDFAGTTKNLSGTIPAQGIVVYENTGAAWLNNLSANGDGDRITLKNNSGTQIDKVTYQKSSSTIVDAQSVSATDPSAGQSITRTTDGGATWAVATTPTKGWFNGSPTPSIASLVSTINASGITTNLGGLDNPSAAEGLDFEKSGKGKITFNTTLNLTNQNTKNTLQNLGSRLDMATVGHIGFNPDLATDLRNANAALEMYNLDSLGITDTPALIVKDDNGVEISPSSLNYPTLTDLAFTPGESGGKLTFSTNHFSQFDINNNVYVSPNGDDNSTTGLQSNPFLTIQHAVNVVPAGSTVNILAGSYDEAVTVAKNLTIRGTGNTTIWEETSGADAALTITTGNVTVEKINFSNADTAILVNGGNVTVKNSQISGNNTNGVTAGAGVTLVTASHNWWGFQTGPTHSTNSGGTGDSVSNNVQYRPYYTDEARTTLSASTISAADFSPATFFSSGIFSLPSGVTNQSSTPSVNINQQLTITVAVSGGVSNVVLPQGTTITKIGGGNIDSTLLAAANVSAGSLSGFGSGTTVDGALQWGIPNMGLEFSQPITVNINVGTNFNGQTLDVVRSTTGTGGWTSDGIVPPATCTVAAGVCTFQATKASFYAATHTPSAPAPSGDGGGGGGDGGDGLGCAVHDCSVHPVLQNLVLGVSTPRQATGFVAPGILGVTTDIGNIGLGEQGQIKGEATQSAQPEVTVQPQAQTSTSPFNIKTILIVIVALLLGFGVFKLIVK